MSSSNPISVLYDSLDPVKATQNSIKKRQTTVENFLYENTKSFAKLDNNNNITECSSPIVPKIDTKETVRPKEPTKEKENNEENTSDSSIESSNNNKKENKFISSLLDMDTAKEVLSALAFTVWRVIYAIVLTFIPRSYRFKCIHGQRVLITGAGSGIGRLMAKKFALDHGAVIIAWDINKTGNDETVKEIRESGGKCFGYCVDVSSREAIYAAGKKVKEEIGKVDILINNAGIVSGKNFLDIPDEMILKTFQVNTLSAFWTTKVFLPDMLKDGEGHLVTIASMAGMIGVNKLVDYCSSKFAAIGFDEAIRNEINNEWGENNINTSVICPYYINTGMFDGVRSKLIRILKPEDVVDDIVAGVLTNQTHIVIPRYAYLLILLKHILPADAGSRCAASFGITGSMMKFKGRPSDSKKK